MTISKFVNLQEKRQTYRKIGAQSHRPKSGMDRAAGLPSESAFTWLSDRARHRKPREQC
ncbi:hypothetical protein D1BOALGB6SA_134 [Olavius sp. associated proteobacterium Delta 1]|nr:hypothetical protein D1BOALGB6SA_134 [Olavius sp. associated proteobacterium Delta 1]